MEMVPLPAVFMATTTTFSNLTCFGFGTKMGEIQSFLGCFKVSLKTNRLGATELFSVLTARDGWVPLSLYPNGHDTC